MIQLSIDNLLTVVYHLYIPITMVSCDLHKGKLQLPNLEIFKFLLLIWLNGYVYYSAVVVVGKLNSKTVLCCLPLFPDVFAFY